MTLTDFRYIAMEPVRAALRDLAAARAKVPADSAEGRELDALIRDTDKGLTEIAVNAANRQTERERQMKWEEILPRCRAALDKVTELNRQLQPAIERAIVARNSLAIAESNLANAQANRPRPEAYPTRAELAEHSAIESSLQAAVDVASKNCRAATAGQDEAAGALFAAQKQFNALAFQERQLRPRTAKEPAWSIPSVGQLSAVR
jgi:hypothetical protein